MILDTHAFFDILWFLVAVVVFPGFLFTFLAALSKHLDTSMALSLDSSKSLVRAGARIRAIGVTAILLLMMGTPYLDWI